mmetsp:Transcript_104552/g.205039  ORF Transcript_104552/g.205039 Transcript_104552/m.205039 type:complete len:343 (-) Transcript_104552:87-1115(-)
MKGGKKDEQPQWDPAFEPVMKILLGKKGIKTKSASEVGKKKVDYFRGKDFKKFVLENPQLLKKKCQAALTAALGPDGDLPETEKDVEKIGDELISRNFCFKAVYKPINPTKDQADKPAKKWPDRLARTPNQRFDCEGFYVITYEGGGSMQHFMLALIISGVLLACMFPVWPMWAKVGIWYLSVIFLSLYFGVLILRMVVFTLFWIVGFDFWIFPNINDEYCGFLDSFRPVYSWEKRKDDAFMLLVRFSSLAMTAVAVKQIAETHSLADVQDFVTSSYTDILDWGVEKLTALPPVERQALPSLEELHNQTLDDHDHDEDLKADDPKVHAGEDDDDDAEATSLD